MQYVTREYAIELLEAKNYYRIEGSSDKFWANVMDDTKWAEIIEEFGYDMVYLRCGQGSL